MLDESKPNRAMRLPIKVRTATTMAACNGPALCRFLTKA